MGKRLWGVDVQIDGRQFPVKGNHMAIYFPEIVVVLDLETAVFSPVLILETTSQRQDIDDHMCAVKFLSWRQDRVPSTPVGGNPLAAKFACGSGVPTFEEDIPWLREVGVAERRPESTSRDVRSRRSSRPRHLRVLYFPHHRLWIMEYSCKVWCKPCRRRLILKLHSKHSWRPRQEGEMEQYLEEKKASQKRPAATFQQQDKKKMVYQTQQRSVAVGNTQRPQDQGFPKTSAGSSAWSASPSSGSGSSASYRKTRKASSPSS
ncbi:hypothetical protein Taro_056451, partial [Colocasia esculenta]|nr:hypothetical protein [Colocasia esculenta]